MALSDEEIVSIIDAHRRNSLGDESSELSQERATALDHYHGRPYGDEQEGRSQVVSRDLAETVDWIMPAIMKTFLQSGNLAAFEGTGEDDEELANQETEYTNHVIMKENSGFLVLHDAIKDTLLLKNGYVKHWWDEEEKTTEQEYTGLYLIELAQLLQNLEKDGGEYEVIEQETETQQTELGPQEVYHVKIRCVKKLSRVRLEAVPTEEIRISKNARNGTQDSGFIEHFTTKTRTDLIEMGMAESFVDSLPAKNTLHSGDDQRRARDSITDESDDYSGSFDRSMDEIDYSEAYLRIDVDGDGRAELRKIITVAENRIPPGDEWNEIIDVIPLTSFVAKRVPHRHVGESLDDDLADLSKIKTVLTRQLMDNVYGTNNQQLVINKLAHIPDFIQSLPGGLKRINTDQPVAGHVMPLVHAPIVDQILPVIDYIDRVKSSRTGISELTTSVDPDVLKKSTAGAFSEGVTRASQKVEMIIRMLAETGAKELVLRVHDLLIKHQDKPKIVKLRGKYVEIDPRSWADRSDLTVMVGIGNGTEEEQRNRLSLIAQLQESLKEIGLVGPQEAYNLFDDFAETLGAKNATRYAMDPQGEAYQQVVAAQQQAAQNQVNPLAEVEQVKGQFSLQREQMAAQFKSQMNEMERNYKAEMESLKLALDAKNQESERLSRETIEAAKLEVQAMLAGMKLDLGKPGIGEGLQ